MQKLFEAYVSKRFIELLPYSLLPNAAGVRFTAPNGTVISSDDTTWSLDLEDGDTLQALRAAVF